MHVSVNAGIGRERETSYKGDNIIRIGNEETSPTYLDVGIPICICEEKLSIGAGEVIKYELLALVVHINLRKLICVSQCSTNNGGIVWKSIFENCVTTGLPNEPSTCSNY